MVLEHLPRNNQQLYTMTNGVDKLSNLNIF